jgi:hypothetical protein
MSISTRWKKTSSTQCSPGPRGNPGQGGVLSINVVSPNFLECEGYRETLSTLFGETQRDIRDERIRISMLRHNEGGGKLLALPV